ncbi:MAG: DNA polymerase IV [Promethearchaeota archaeon]
MNQIIFHVDLDCFFASVYLINHPECRNVPLIIGADPKKGMGRGVVSTCSYEAREFGVHSAMPISTAYRLCPHAIYTHVDFHRIHDVSKQVMSILSTYSPLFEPAGIDEAYLDLSDIAHSWKEAWNIANELKDRVHREVGVTCSVGISFSKTLAKIGSDCKKPNGVTLLHPDNYKSQLENLIITRIPGIGKKTKIYYMKKGFETIGDLYKYNLRQIGQKLGEHGIWAWKSAHGLDGRKVYDGSFERTRKSISKERTFHEDVTDPEIIIEKLTELNKRIHQSLRKKKLYYRTITLKIRFHGFETFTRSISLNNPLCNQEKALEKVLQLLEEFSDKKKPVRLIGLKFSNFASNRSLLQKNLLVYI